MVIGLDKFRDHFSSFQDQYVLIGGTATSIAMEIAGLEFRSTKDLDIVLHIESLSPEFASAFWEFIKQGKYAIQESSTTQKPVFYRFKKPADQSFPAMIELFSRVPDNVKFTDPGHLTPIPISEEISSLSAILMNDTYYTFLMDGRATNDDLTFIKEDRLTPLKARAWLDLSARQANGDPVDNRDIRKHANDVIRLSELLVPGQTTTLPADIHSDLLKFIAGIGSDTTIKPKDLGVVSTKEVIIQRISTGFQSL